MPVPKPKTGETEDEFISRFMGDSVMIAEYPDATQRSAVAHSYWDGAKKKAGK
jgi:hypothetical protein